MNYRDAELIRQVFHDRRPAGYESALADYRRVIRGKTFLALWDAMVAYIQEAEVERAASGEERV